MPALLGQAEGQIASVVADNAYDGEPTYADAVARQRHSPPDVIIPPRPFAVLSTEDVAAQSPRDRHIRLMAEQGRLQAISRPILPGDRFAIAWQRATGYGRRNYAATAFGRYKHLIDPKLRARSLPAQRSEVAIAVAALNTAIRTTKPVSVRVA